MKHELGKVRLSKNGTTDENREIIFSLLFEPCDLWIGAFWDRKSRKLYILPVPCIGVVIQFPSPARREG